jgi:DNA-binding XRE family transcriptional regulator
MYNRIMLFRVEAGLSRKQLAEMLGVNAQTIGYLERGDYSPSLELGMKLASTFRVRVETLFSLDPFPSVAGALEQEREGPHGKPRT